MTSPYPHRALLEKNGQCIQEKTTVSSSRQLDRHREGGSPPHQARRRPQHSTRLNAPWFLKPTACVSRMLAITSLFAVGTARPPKTVPHKA